jgi:hypothetical protein
MSSDDHITVRDWRPRPPLRLHMRRIKNPANPAMQRVSEDDRF